MKILKNSWLLVSLCFALPSHAASVWKVSNGNSHLFLAGTIHVLSAEDYPLPSAYDKAYQGADTLVFETDIHALKQPNFQRQLQSVMMLQNGDKLHQYLNKTSFTRLNDYLTQHGIPYHQVENFTPAALSIFLTLQVLSELEMTEEGVDLYYANKAQQDGKTQGWLETLEEQIALLSRLNQIEANIMLCYTLEDVSTLPSAMDKIKQSWRSGKLEALNKTEIMDFKSDYPAIYDVLLTQRNKLWVPQITQMFDTPEVELVLVGALHLAGPDSLLNTLATQGYRIEQW